MPTSVRRWGPALSPSIVLSVVALVRWVSKSDLSRKRSGNWASQSLRSICRFPSKMADSRGYRAGEREIEASLFLELGQRKLGWLSDQLSGVMVGVRRG